MIDATTEANQPESRPKGKPHLLTVLGWGLMACLALALIFPLLVGVRMRDTASFFSAMQQDQPIPTLPPDASQSIAGVSLGEWFLDEPWYFSADTFFTEEALFGTTDDGTRAYFFAWDEAGFNEYLAYWFTDTVLEDFPDFSNPWLSLRPGAIIVSVDQQIGDGVQRLGFIYELDETRQQFAFSGVDLGDNMLVAQEGSFLDGRGLLLQNLANRTLRELVLYDDDGAEYFIDEIYLDDEVAQVLLLPNEQE
jgi:hypothetical protein